MTQSGMRPIACTCWSATFPQPTIAMRSIGSEGGQLKAEDQRALYTSTGLFAELSRFASCFQASDRFREHFCSQTSRVVFDKYPDSCCRTRASAAVSAISPSASVSLLTKWASYRRFCPSLGYLAPIDLEDRRIWSVREYFSSAGNASEAMKISCCEFICD